ncbi:MAG: type I restriction-modification system subunit M [Actinomycetota bacterium]|nr:type I restriction-modification system subunit M [Actinomycetota bacterium]
MATDLAELRRRLWDAADELRANSNLTANQYRDPVLGLIFLAFAEQRFDAARDEVEASAGRRRKPGPEDYQARGVLYLTDEARLSTIALAAEGIDIGSALNRAMGAIERDNDELAGVLPMVYVRLGKPTLVELIRLLAPLTRSVEGDAFGLIYEYFLAAFAMEEGRGGGEFFTPASIVSLLVEVIGPYHGRILDPACGSGGMFVHSAKFVNRHKRDAASELGLYGCELKEATLPLAKMNLALHGLGGDIIETNSYYEDPFSAVGRFDYVLANPPFNVDKVDKSRLDGDRRYPFGMPRADNANYLWIQLFWSALKGTGRAGFVMANSAADARSTELDIRRQLIQTGTVDVVVAISSNFFYSVTLPVTLWFFDKSKATGTRRDEVLFIDARHTFRQVDRAHRDFTPDQTEFLANIVRLWRGEPVEDTAGSVPLLATHFAEDQYADVPGLCKVATIAEIESHGWSLNPGRYVGTAAIGDDHEEFVEQIAALYEEFATLSARAADLTTQVDAVMQGLLE